MTSAPAAASARARPVLAVPIPPLRNSPWNSVVTMQIRRLRLARRDRQRASHHVIALVAASLRGVQFEVIAPPIRELLVGNVSEPTRTPLLQIAVLPLLRSGARLLAIGGLRKRRRADRQTQMLEHAFERAFEIRTDFLVCQRQSQIAGIPQEFAPTIVRVLASLTSCVNRGKVERYFIAAHRARTAFWRSGRSSGWSSLRDSGRSPGRPDFRGAAR